MAKKPSAEAALPPGPETIPRLVVELNTKARFDVDYLLSCENATNKSEITQKAINILAELQRAKEDGKSICLFDNVTGEKTTLLFM